MCAGIRPLQTCIVVKISAKRQGMDFISLHNICAVQWEDIMSTLRVFSTPGDIMSTLGEYHDKCGEGHWQNNEICMETPVY